MGLGYASAGELEGQQDARQAKVRWENRYVIKVTSLNKERGQVQVFWFARTKPKVVLSLFIDTMIGVT